MRLWTRISILLCTILVTVLLMITHGSDKQFVVLSKNINKETENTTFIIIVSYYRSGSTLLAQIVQQSKQVFYVFEPFTRVSYDDILVYENDEVCNAMNGRCRKPIHLFEQSSFVLKQLQHFSNCNLNMLEKTFMEQQNDSSDALQLAICRKQNDSFLCLQKARKNCQSKIRFIKTIRMSLQVLKQTIIHTPAMKIVYLVRDPRGVINSRLFSPMPGIAGNKNVTTLAHAQCGRYYSDFKVFDSLPEETRKRIKIVSYEDIVSEPFIATKELYQFLNLSYNHNISSWLELAMFSGMKSGYYQVFRPNATDTAYKWRTMLSKENITKIDQICRHLYPRLNVRKT